jgi:DNA gyrase subunit A
VRLQRLDKGDRLADVVLVPPEAETDDDNEAVQRSRLNHQLRADLG